MSFKVESKTGDVILSGWEQGIAPSPHKGVANLKGVNITTESNEVMTNYSRFQQSQTGTAAANQTGTAISTSRLSSTFSVLNGTQINITASSVSGLSTGLYFVVNSSATPTSSGGVFQLGTIQTTGFGGAVTWAGTSGSITFNIVVGMSQPVQAATEQYVDGSANTQYRYYILDVNGFVWVYDTALINNMVTGNLFWYLPDSSSIASNSNARGIAVFNGYVHVFVGNKIFVKETVLLAQNNAGSAGWDTFTGGNLNSAYNSNNSHFALVTQSNTLTYCDGPFLGTIESSSNSGAPATAVPIWSYGQYTFSTTTLTVADQIGGSNLINGSTVTLTSSGTVPTGANATTLYYAVGVTISGNAVTFGIATTVGGSAISLSGGSGNQYFNTYKPSHSSGNTTYVFNPQACSLPFTAVSQSLCEIGTTVVVGTQSNFLYIWDEINPLPTGFIPLPENNAQYMINVNNMAYVFAGSKGNIYVTNGSTASLALSVPDYTTGQIEPYFVWGGAAYIRGRIFFSIQDQNASHTGQCGGVWSFVPTQNFFIGQDFGLALRIENPNSYGNYNGVANVILNSQNQNANGPQYWTGWSSSVSSPTYGIDASSTTALTTATIETDIVPVGTYTAPANFAGIEIKLAAPLIAGESVQVLYRTNLSFGAFTNVGTLNFGDTTDSLSTRFKVPFKNVQWIQFQVILQPITASVSSFVRLSETRIYRQTP